MTRRLAAAVDASSCSSRAAAAATTAREKSVSQYIEDVNSVQHGLSLPLGQVALGYRELAQRLEPRDDAAEAREVGARRSASSSGASTRSIRRPRRYGSTPLILRLVHGEAQLAEELAQLAAYVH